MIDVAESAHGIWTQPLQASNWSGVSGASLAPKSTVRAVMAAMPPPEPIGEYWSSYPKAAPTGAIHWETSGETNELPAPLRVVPLRFAGAAPAVPAATTASAAASAARTTMRTKLPDFGMGFSPPSGFAATVRLRPPRVGYQPVSRW